jgi:ubiquinone/menaquinone biosynthesis C-methylase UbiE
MSETSSSQVTPQRILGMGWGFALPLVINAAIQNGIFDALDRSPMTAKELAKETGASERGISAVAGALTGFDLLTKQKDGRYQLAPDAEAFLVKGKPGFHGGMFEHYQSDLIPNWLALSEITRSGQPKTDVDQPETGAVFFEGLVDALFPLNYAAAQTLAQSLEASRAAKGNLNEEVEVLDLAAGSGVWGIAQAQASPRVRVTAVDFENVLAVTRRTAERFGLGGRFRFLSGDIRTADLGQGYSVALLGHILHSEGVTNSRALLKRVFAALRPGGTIAIAEFLVNAERTGPAQGVIFAVNMLVHTTEGDTFSFEEIGSWLKSEGFENIRTLEAPAPSPLILADKPGKAS